jgi:GNAT superfamily N-acetyltransferase
MLFATSSLAARIDRAEFDTSRTMTELAGRRQPGVYIGRIGSTAALIGGRDAPYNKLIALGFDDGLDEAGLEAAEREHDRRGAALRVELATLADPLVAAALTARGYRLIGFENVLGILLTDISRREATTRDVDVQPVQSGAAGEWLETLLAGFAVPDRFDGPPPTESFTSDTMREVLADWLLVPSVRLYAARRGGELAGAGSLRIVDGIAMMSGTATRQQHRRRGVQTALLRARLEDARHAGCDIAVVTTEPASKSQENIQRAGFSLLYSRAILLRTPR